MKETRRVERIYKGVLGVRFAGQVWVKPEDETGFAVWERPHVTEATEDTVTVERVEGQLRVALRGQIVDMKEVNGRLRESWQRLKPVTGDMSMTELIEQVVRHATRVDGKGYRPEDVEIIMQATALPGPARAFAGWTRQARIGGHSTQPRQTGDERDVLGALLGILGSMESAKP